MGEVINLDDRRRRAMQPQRRMLRRPMSFYVDLVSPEGYLAAERVDRLFGTVTWVAVPAFPSLGADLAERRDLVAARAVALHMPLVWPERSSGSERTTRIATLAAEQGALAPFALAIGRLAFCGGFDVDDPEILAEAAAAAGLDMDACLQAAADPSRDDEPKRVAANLLARGADRLPVLEVGSMLFCGEDRLPEALAAVRSTDAPAAQVAPSVG